MSGALTHTGGETHLRVCMRDVNLPDTFCPVRAGMQRRIGALSRDTSARRRAGESRWFQVGRSGLATSQAVRRARTISGQVARMLPGYLRG